MDADNGPAKESLSQSQINTLRLTGFGRFGTLQTRGWHARWRGSRLSLPILV
jgi:hypothetical protein